MASTLGREKKCTEWNDVSENRFMHLKLQTLKVSPNPLEGKMGDSRKKDP
jgi:hypothetical protein